MKSDLLNVLPNEVDYEDPLKFWFKKENESIWFNPSHIEDCYITNNFSHFLEKG